MTAKLALPPLGALALALSWLAPVTAARAATWTVDPAKSRLGFTGRQSGEPFKGRFRSFTAAIDFDPARPEAARVAVKVDVASATTDDAQKDEALPTPDWFDAASFATATFEARGFVPKGGDAYEARGTLTLRGVRRDVVLPFALTIAGDAARATGHARIVRTDFGVGQGAWASGDDVALDVEVDVDLTATRGP